MRKLAFFLLLQFCVYVLIAQEQPEKKKGMTASSELVLQVSSLPEAKLGFTERFKFPFKQGLSPLKEDNNITLALTAEISPISLNGVFDAVWTPIAFFQLAGGGSIG